MKSFLEVIKYPKKKKKIREKNLMVYETVSRDLFLITCET